MYYYIKRVIDIVGAIIGIIFLLPVFGILALAVYLDSPGPVLFRQRRIGRKKKEFYILKFRTMKQEAPHNTPTHLLDTPECYITRTGKFLRRTSLDELPQLFNILKGDMSFIGPRPALWNQEDLLQERERYGANNVPVGLSGWAQVNGRDTLSMKEKAKLDGEYAKNISFIMDCRCVGRTVYCLWKQEGLQEGKQKAEDGPNTNYRRD